MFPFPRNPPLSQSLPRGIRPAICQTAGTGGYKSERPHDPQMSGSSDAPTRDQDQGTVPGQLGGQSQSRGNGGSKRPPRLTFRRLCHSRQASRRMGHGTMVDITLALSTPVSRGPFVRGRSVPNESKKRKEKKKYRSRAGLGWASILPSARFLPSLGKVATMVGECHDITSGVRSLSFMTDLNRNRRYLGSQGSASATTDGQRERQHMRAGDFRTTADRLTIAVPAE